MSKRDYYEILGIDRNANEADIKKAYRRLAMKYHPDRNTGASLADAEKKFKEVKEAYEVLSNRKKRATYDQFGHAGVEQTVNENNSSGFDGGGFSDIFGDVFGDIFGSNRNRGNHGSQSNRGADLRYRLDLSLEDAVTGIKVKIRIPTLVVCRICKGNGAKPNTTPKSCGTCHGTGQVRLQQGFFTVQQTCPNCHGHGTIINNPCSNCRGRGRVEEQKTLSVKVPSGVDTGDRIRLTGEGEVGEIGGPSGDLYVEVAVKKHDIFQRDGSNLYCEVPISITTAALGGELEVPTLSGKIRLKIPAGTQAEKMFRMRGKGIKPVRGGLQGDLICRVRVETPVNLTPRQKELLTEFQETLKGEHSRHNPQFHSWLGGVKRFFSDMGF